MSSPENPTLSQRFADALCRWRWVLLAVAFASAALSIPPSLQLQFEQSIESLYERDNPRLVALQQSKAWFGGDEFVIVAWNEPNLFKSGNQLSPESVEHILRISAKLKAIPGFDPNSVQNLADALRFPYGRSQIRQFMEGILLGADETTTAVIIRLLPEGKSPIPRGETFRLVRQMAAEETPPAFVLGEPVQVHDMFRYVEQDGATLGVASTGLLLLVILVLFRSFRWMLLPLAIVQTALLGTKAILVLSGTPLSMVSTMLDSLTTIIGIATVMHLTLVYRKAAQSLPREKALSRTLADLSLPITWTILTTVAGFGSLMTSRIAPVASFGLMMSAATFLVLLATFLVMPGFVLIGPKTRVPGVAPLEYRISNLLANMTSWVLRRPRSVAVVMTVLAAFCAAGLLRLQVETDFSKNFRANSPIVQALDFFETRLGGAGTWEVGFPAPKELNEDFLNKVRALTEDLRELEERQTPNRLTKVISLTDGVDLIPRKILFRTLSLETRLSFLNSLQSDFQTGLYNAEAGQMRIVLRALERQSADTKIGLIEEVEAIARQHFPTAEATGVFVLLTYLIDSLLGDQWTSFGISAGAIVLLMTLALRDWKIGVISLAPNLFPIVLVIGTMGWIGLPINIATAMIASVSIGLTVDSTIHYIWSFRRSVKEGATFEEALRSTHEGVGLALVFSNVALVAGFSVLTLSHFIPTIYFGVLVSAAMLGGLAGNLVLLPLLLIWTDRPAVSKIAETAEGQVAN